MATKKKATTKKAATKTKKAEVKSGDFWDAITKEKTAKEKAVLDGWSSIAEILQDGRIEPKEVPRLLAAIASLLGDLASLLTVLVVDPKITALLAVIAKVLTSLSKSIEKQTPKILENWKAISRILEDNEVDLKEVAPLLIAISNLVEAGIAIVFPFLDPEFSEAASKLVSKIQKVLRFLDRFGGGPKPPKPKILI